VTFVFSPADQLITIITIITQFSIIWAADPFDNFIGTGPPPQAEDDRRWASENALLAEQRWLRHHRITDAQSFSLGWVNNVPKSKNWFVICFIFFD